jgi:hypothetical protein
MKSSELIIRIFEQHLNLFHLRYSYMKKKIIATILLILCILSLTYFFFTYNSFNDSSVKTLIHADNSSIVKILLEKGDILRGSNQDSSTYYYNKAIEKSISLPWVISELLH